MTGLEELKNLGFPRLDSVTLDVTTQCNLRCPHCILSEDTRADRSCYVDVDRFARLLPTLVKLGCHSISLAGGEPLLHKELPLILRLCRRANMDITLYTNGTLLNQDLIRALRSTPGLIVTVSFYAASDEAYQRLSVDGAPGLFTAMKRGIEQLRRLGVPHKLQVFIYRSPMSGYDELQRSFPDQTIARGWNIIPRSGTDRCNQNCMVPAEDARDRIHRREAWPESLRGLFQFLYDKKTVFSCAAGMTMAHIGSRFSVHPCLYVGDPEMAFSLEDHSFEEIFFEKMPRALLKRIPASSPCQTCTVREPCFRCHASGYGTNWADQGEHSLCKIAHIAEEKRLEASVHD